MINPRDMSDNELKLELDTAFYDRNASSVTVLMSEQKRRREEPIINILKDMIRVLMEARNNP